MAKVLIVYHSQSGNTEEMAKKVAEGVKEGGATVILKKAVDANAQDFLGCDVIAFGTPNYFGYMCGMVKDYFDRIWVTVREKADGKPYATFGSKGGGGAEGIASVERICDGLRMKKLLEGVLATRKPTEEVLTQCRDFGKKLAHPEDVKPLKVKEPRL